MRVMRFCPDCVREMSSLSYGGLTVDTCPSCAGIWFDEDELHSLHQAGPQAFRDLDDRVAPSAEVRDHPDRMKKCPRCTSALERYRYQYTSPIELDGCEGCHGVWVQDGELRKMADFAEEDSQTETPLDPRVAVAQLKMDTDDAIARQRAVQGAFRFLSVRRPWRML
jgi:Zn-finger nucleic acid-binding protein